MANFITFLRIVISLAMLFLEPFSQEFYYLYFTAGLTDMLDGRVARNNNTVSEFGSKLDTMADIVLVAVCIIKLLPVLSIPMWVHIWIAGIAIIKLDSIINGYITQKKFVAVHSIFNKVTGVLLFIIPFTFLFIDPTIPVVAVCALSTVAAVLEGYTIRKMQPVE